ncbi:MAG: hypothetical protein H6807_06430 [Planctomycetes bacterium]|nr:hypothetical protein [Planctomycetota bacterium]
MKTPLLLVALLALGACSSRSFSARLDLAPGGSFSHRGAGGEVAVENEGPGSVEVSTEDEDGHQQVETTLDADEDCELELEEGGRLKIRNDSERLARVRIEGEED